MLIFTFSLGNDGREKGSRDGRRRGFKEFNSIKKYVYMYICIYILSIDKTVKVKYLILFIIRASSGHWSFARKSLILFLI